MSIAGRKFNISWGMSLAAFSLSAILASLGIWQLQRAEEKRHLQFEVDQRSTAKPIIITKSLAEHWQSKRFSKVVINGNFDTKNQLLMDNRVMNGKAGYDVITPFNVAGTDLKILVNRGWISTGKDRGVMPDIIKPENNIKVTGRISAPRSRPPILSADAKPDQYADKVWTHLDIQYFENKYGANTEPYIILAESNLQDQLVRQWPRFDAKVTMHIGYAIQWFAFSLFVLILWLGSAFKKTE